MNLINPKQLNLIILNDLLDVGGHASLLDPSYI